MISKEDKYKQYKQGKNPIFTDLLNISKEIRRILIAKRNRMLIKCIFLIAFIAMIVAYQFLYVVNGCFIEVYSYYQAILASLYIIDFYMETIYVKIIIRYINIFKWEQSNNNEEKYLQLKNIKVRQMIYKLVNKNYSGELLPLTVIHHRKMVVGAFVLVFFTQFYFTTNYEEFQCYFDYEPIVMNIIFWVLYILMILFRQLKLCNCLYFNHANNQDIKQNQSSSSFHLQQYSSMTVEQLEQEWKLRSTEEKVVYWEKKKDINNNNQGEHQEKQNNKDDKKINKNEQNINIQQNENENEQFIDLKLNSNSGQDNNIYGNINKNIFEPTQLNHINLDQNQDNSQKQNNTNNEKEIIVQITNRIEESDKLQQEQQQGLEKISENNNNNNKEQEVCQICLIDLQDGEIGRQIKCCKKIFHKECCLQWFNMKETCPNCRALPLISFN